MAAARSSAATVCVYSFVLIALLQLTAPVHCAVANPPSPYVNPNPSPYVNSNPSPYVSPNPSPSVASQNPSPFTNKDGMYVSAYDRIDVDRLLKIDRVVTAYIRCFLNEGACTPEGIQVKNYLLPEIISTVCAKCSPKQKNIARKVLTHVYTTRPNEFNRIMAMYDKDNKKEEIIKFMKTY